MFTDILRHCCLFDASHFARILKTPLSNSWRFILTYLALTGLQFANAQPIVQLPKTGLTPSELAIVYLRDDKASLALAKEYQHARDIPAANLFSVAFSPKEKRIDPGHFAVQYASLQAKLPDAIQAILLAWDQPYRVGCMGISAAFAFGYDVGYCANSCEKTRLSPYYHTVSTRPWQDFGLRPTMMLAGPDLESNRRIIASGIAADESMPRGKVLLLETSDKGRSVRKQYFTEVEQRYGELLSIKRLRSNAAIGENRVLSYVAGTSWVEGLETIGFLPGALADHLTSHGGRLTDSTQMSAVEWLKNGATASYGTAVEPCNFVEKFPNPVIKLWHYLRGATAIEAYWKSVQMPGQGNFVGEPLAAPFRGYRLKRMHGGWRLISPTLYSGRYAVYGGEYGAERLLETQTITKYKKHLFLAEPISASYVIKRQR